MWQVFFSMTELVAGIATYRMLDKRLRTNMPGLAMLLVVSLMHMLQSLIDQGLINLVTLSGRVCVLRHCTRVLNSHWSSLFGRSLGA